MKRKIFHPLWIRVAGFILALFFIYSFYSIAGDFYNKSCLYSNITPERIVLLCFMFAATLFFIFLAYMVNVSYVFGYDHISIIYPFREEIKIRKYDIKGWAAAPGQYFSDVYFFYRSSNKKRKKEKINVTGKRLSNEIDAFIKRNYKVINSQNLQDIKSYGYEFKITGRKKIFINNNRIEVSGNINTTAYPWTDIKKIEIKQVGMIIWFFIIPENGKTIKFSNLQAEGAIGLFDYIKNVIIPKIP